MITMANVDTSPITFPIVPGTSPAVRRNAATGVEIRVQKIAGVKGQRYEVVTPTPTGERVVDDELTLAAARHWATERVETIQYYELPYAFDEALEEDAARRFADLDAAHARIREVMEDGTAFQPAWMTRAAAPTEEDAAPAVETLAGPRYAVEPLTSRAVKDQAAYVNDTVTGDVARNFTGPRAIADAEAWAADANAAYEDGGEVDAFGEYAGSLGRPTAATPMIDLRWEFSYEPRHHADRPVLMTHVDKWGQTDHSSRFTVAEAREVAASLNRLADLAEEREQVAALNAADEARRNAPVLAAWKAAPPVVAANGYVSHPAPPFVPAGKVWIPGTTILVVADDNSATVQIMTIDDPTNPWADDSDPMYAAQCRTPGCEWNSFVVDGTIFIYETDAINEADRHLDDHERAIA
jgi:hypothetical protein